MGHPSPEGGRSPGIFGGIVVEQRYHCASRVHIAKPLPRIPLEMFAKNEAEQKSEILGGDYLGYKSKQWSDGITIFIVVPGLLITVAIVLLVAQNSGFLEGFLRSGVREQELSKLLATLLLGAAAVMGIVLAIGHFTGNRPPLYLGGMLHGMVAILGAIALTAFVLGGPSNTDIQYALAIFLVTIALGIFFFVYRRLRRALPSSLIVIHALLAIVGYIFLLRG